MATVSAPSSVRERPARRRRRFTRKKVTGSFWTLVTCLLAFIMFFPVLWMIITSFKTEGAAYTTAPRLHFHPTLTEYHQVFSSGGAGGPFVHSIIISALSVVLVIMLGLPAAYALSIRPVVKWRNTLFFFLTTKMMPYVAAIVPIYIIALHIHLLDTVWVLIILYTGFNLPIAVWMIRSFLLEIPRELVEAARLDGAGLLTELTRVILPLALPGIAATALICVIFSWNEFFFAYFLTATRSPTVPVFLAKFQASEGQYWAKLAAAAVIACLPVVLAGWVSQKQLVRGLSLGALK
jgi:sorbitol/mannitol transport system permease protein